MAETTSKNQAAKGDEEKEDAKPKIYHQKYSNGQLAEAILVAGLPYFLVSGRDGRFTTAERIELMDKILVPLESRMYLNKPYSFSSYEELQAYVEKASRETLDSLYNKVKTICKRYIAADNYHISLLATDIIYSYYQDRIGLTHYLFFVGNNSSGKSNNLKVINELAYRNMKSTDVTPANIYRFLGSDEEGQGTICEDEADGIDFNHDKMRIYKEGYTATGSRVMRSDSTNYGVKQYAFNTFCFKAFAAERLPDSVKAKGFNQRCIEIPCFYGIPDYDITEVVNPAGVEEYQDLLNELIETRNTLLIYRMLHHQDPIPTVKLNIDGRENQLFSPLIRVFQGTRTLSELLPVISRYVSQRRERTANSYHAYLYRVIRELVNNQDKTELEFSVIWESVTGGLAGTFKTESRQTYESEEFGSISRKGLSEQLQQIFGARQSQNRREARKLVFDKSKLDRLAQQYDMDIQVEIVTGVTDVTGSARGIGIEKFYETAAPTANDNGTTIESMGSTDNEPQTHPRKLSHLSQPSPRTGLESYGAARVSMFHEIATELEKSSENHTVEHEELHRNLVSSGKFDAGGATSIINEALEADVLQKIDWHVYKIAQNRGGGKAD